MCISVLRGRGKCTWIQINAQIQRAAPNTHTDLSRAASQQQRTLLFPPATRCGLLSWLHVLPVWAFGPAWSGCSHAASDSVLSKSNTQKTSNATPQSTVVPPTQGLAEQIASEECFSYLWTLF